MDQVIQFKRREVEESVDEPQDTLEGEFHWYLVAYSYSSYSGHGDGAFYHYSQYPYTKFGVETQQGFLDSATGFATEAVSGVDTIKKVIVLGVTYLGYGTKQEFISND